MARQPEVQPVTADELLRMPEDGFRYELIRGELRRSDLNGAEHGRVALTVAVALDAYIRVHRLGTAYAAGTGFQLAVNPDTVRAPDVAFVRKERADEIGDIRGYFPGAPDLVVEVVSPGDTYSEVVEKTFDWIGAGARLVLVVDPRRRSVTLYRSREEIRVLAEDEVLDGGDVVPGWRVPVRELFA
jgi:Uma2 family endonuclease